MTEAAGEGAPPHTRIVYLRGPLRPGQDWFALRLALDDQAHRQERLRDIAVHVSGRDSPLPVGCLDYRYRRIPE
jgi:hypothetical protein